MQYPARLLVPGAIGIFILALVFCARPVRVASGEKSEVIWLWAWQRCELHFVNSVTGRPVSMRFGLPWHFSGFSAHTDPDTESYYTGGEYSWNEKLAGESTRELDYCSEVGISLRLGQFKYQIRHGCVRAAMLWPP